MRVSFVLNLGVALAGRLAGCLALQLVGTMLAQNISAHSKTFTSFLLDLRVALVHDRERIFVLGQRRHLGEAEGEKRTRVKNVHVLHSKNQQTFKPHQQES